MQGEEQAKISVEPHAQRLTSALVAGTATGWLVALADAVAREGWTEVSPMSHWTWALLLYGGCGALLGFTAWLAATGCTSMSTWLARWQSSARWCLAPAIAAVTGGWLFVDTAFWAFSGRGVAGTTLARYGPLGALVALAGAMAAYALLLQKGFALRRRRPRVTLGISALLMAAGGVLIAIDLTVLVALYRRLHVTLEMLAGLALMGGVTLALTTLRSWRRLRAAFTAGAGLAAAMLLALIASSQLRNELDRGLAHVWSEPVYLGRMLMRVQLTESYLRDPAGWRSARASRMDRLKQRFDIANTSLDQAWLAPQQEPEELVSALRELRRGRDDLNLVVFYVDTLRQDVASDPRVMPNLVALQKRSLHFRHAYSFASDTVSALPVLIGGTYPGDDESHAPDLFDLTERAKIPSALFIATSARRFLAKLVPQFRFDHVIDVPDYDTERKVWGYGADRSSADGVVDEALAWIDRRNSKRFFTWLFHFDVHNWRELENGYVETTAQRLGIDDSRPRLKRYKATAAGVDEALGRFLHGLKERGLEDDTIILFVADHGEALGRQGHWVHAVFLWESLVKTPLVLHVPGIEPRAIDVPVGHVDVLPTLARYLDAEADVTRYQGYDMLRHLVPVDSPEPLPLLMMSMRKEDVLRVGVVSRHAPYQKLVLPLDSAEPQLHDLHGHGNDDIDLARQQPGRVLDLLGKLVRSPIFPREDEKRTEEERTALR